jgi:CDP-glucose 4,6-dehydratase
MNPSFWRGKRVLVTGHTGFKGSWLCLLLDALGAEVSGYALAPPTNPSLFELAAVGDLVESTIADVRDLPALSDYMRSRSPDVVLHMAAQSVVLASYDDPVDTYSTNVLGTVHALEAVRRMGKPCTVVNVTTDKCYENKNWVWGYRESDELGGRDPYSNSKACTELVGHSYRESFFPPSNWREHGVGLASARAGNVIGGGDWTPRQLIPETMAAFAQARPVVLRHPDAVRPGQHVLDCLTGYLSLAEALAADAPSFDGAWNFGPASEESRPVSYIVETLASFWKLESAWVTDGARHAPEENQLRLDTSKAAARLGWTCRLSLDVALSWVASWYQDHHRGLAARDLCCGQIDAYLNLLRSSQSE